MIETILNRFYFFVGVFVIAVGLLFFAWGEWNYNSPLHKDIKTAQGRVQHFEIFESLIEFKLKALSDTFVYHKRYGNFHILINELNNSKQAEVKVMVDTMQRKEIPVKVYFLTINDKKITHFKHSIQVDFLWLKSIRILSLCFVLLGLIGILFGDKLVRKVRADWH